MIIKVLFILLFFFVLLFASYTISSAYRWKLLLLVSIGFYLYMAGPWLVMLLLVAGFTYAGALCIYAARGKMRVQLLTIFFAIAALSPLVYYKYSGFITGTLNYLFPGLVSSSPSDSLFLPLGISFFTFRVLSYLLDVYHGKMQPEKSPGLVILYVMFFPEIIAGPIDRPQRLIPQFRLPAEFNYQKVVSGLKLIAWGVFLKVVVADRLGIYVDTVFKSPKSFTGMPLILASIFFTFQIYYDFAGYSYIAIGAGRALGYDLMKNFDVPYASKSIAEFWRRWHISLSTWFRDYVYIPLGGHRVSGLRWRVNILITFLLSGLWHGANWTFVLWGGIHGAYYIIGAWTKEARARIIDLLHFDKFIKVHSVCRIIFTFILVSIAWVFFRANTISDAYYIVTHCFYGISEIYDMMSLKNALFQNNDMFYIANVLMLFPLIISIECLQLINRKRDIIDRLSNLPIIIRATLYSGFIMIIIILGKYSSETKTFIYGRF